MIIKTIALYPSFRHSMSRKGLFIIMVGLPGSGKSTLARKIAVHIPNRLVEILDGDRINKELHPLPSYSHQEQVELHRFIHDKAFISLLNGNVVIYDATNILESYRKSACLLATRANADYIIVQVTADEDLIRNRLEDRSTDRHNYSDADFAVFMRMKNLFEPIQAEHITVQSTEHDFIDLDRLIVQIHYFIAES